MEGKTKSARQKIRVLAVFANPKGTDALRLEEEERTIRECLKSSRNRNRIYLEILTAARIDDLRRALLNGPPYELIHFSGHGTGKGLVFEDDSGDPVIVPQEALAEFLGDYSPPIQAVLLNACYSHVHGEQLSRAVPFTIAMRAPISDRGAMEFARGFYDALAAGRAVDRAYAEGIYAIKLKGLRDTHCPVLLRQVERPTIIVDERIDGYPYHVALGEFAVEDGEIFFGRDEAINEILGRIEGEQEARFQYIVGPSGVGKSSLLKAGLIYQIVEKQRLRRAHDRWSYTVFKPSDHPNPFMALISALMLPGRNTFSGERADLADEIADQCRQGSLGAKEALEGLLTRLRESSLLIAVNQMEELWTHVDARLRDAFLNLITAVDEHDQVIALATIRGDFESDLTEASQIAPLLNRKQCRYRLGGPSTAELKQMILIPGQKAGIEFEGGGNPGGFIDHVLTDAANLADPDTALPLVSLLLATLRTKDPSDPGRALSTPETTFTISAYEALGGLRGVVSLLTRQARLKASGDILDGFFEKLVDMEDRRRIFRRVPVDALLDLDERRRSKASELLARLVHARLLQIGPTAERLSASAQDIDESESESQLVWIPHDALFTHWPELKGWFQRNLLDLTARDELKHDAVNWLRSGRRRAALRLRGEHLKEIDDILRVRPTLFDSVPTIRPYLTACRIRIERDSLIAAVVRGEMQNAVVSMNKLKELGKDDGHFLEEEDLGYESHQLRPVLYAAITGDDATDEARLERARRNDGARRADEPSIFQTGAGRSEMETTTSRGLTPLHWAATSRKHELVQRLIQSFNARADHLSDRGLTLVGSAAFGGDIRIVRFLVEELGMDPQIPSRDMSPPIIWAIQRKNRDVFDYLLARGQNLSFETTDGFNALTEAARANDVAMIQELIDGHSLDKSHVTNDGQTLIHIACVGEGHQDAEAVTVLLNKYGLDPLAKGGSPDWTPLHVAAIYNNLDAIDALLNVLSSEQLIESALDASDKDGFTPLHSACYCKNWVAAMRLLERGAKPNALDAAGLPPIYYAVQNGDSRSVQALLSKNARTDLTSPSHWTPLCVAADDGDFYIVQALLEADGGIEIDATVEQGWTALMLAAGGDHAEVFSLLLEHGASLWRTNSVGMNAVRIAQLRGSAAVLRVLEELAKTQADVAELLRVEAFSETMRLRTLESALNVQRASVLPETTPGNLSDTDAQSQICVVAPAGSATFARLPVVDGSAEFAQALQGLSESKIYDNISEFDFQRVRSAELPFLPGCRLLLARHENGEIEVPFVLTQDATLLAESVNEWLYELMDTANVVQDPVILRSYCHFFFSVVVGQLGAFRFVDEVEHLPWLSTATQGDENLVRPHLSALEYVGKEEDGRFELRGSVLFKNALFLTSVLVGPDWHLELTKEELVLEDLPVQVGRKVDLLVAY